MEDENRLWIATRRYLLGEISIEELRQIEQPHNDAFNQALYVLARRDIERERKKLINRISRDIMDIRRRKEH